jgi:HK97 family phage major capsid protein
MKKVNIKDFGYNLDNIKDAEQKSFMENILTAMCDVVNKAMEGAITPESMKSQFDAINEKLKGYDAEKFEQLVKDNNDLRDMLKKAMETIEKAKEKGPAAVDAMNRFTEKIGEMYDSEKFRDFCEGHSRKSGAFGGFSLKDLVTVSMTNDYTGTHLITDQLGVVANKYAPKRLHMRDLLTSLTGDPAFPNLAFTEIESMDRNARYATENGRLSESHIKIKEQNVSVKRLGTYLPISKRMLKSRAYIQSYIVAMLPEAVYMAEDWNILFGDGNGENLEGITKKSGCKSVESIITDTIVSGSAGSVYSVSALSTVNSEAQQGIVVEFANPQPDILDGMKITFANAVVNTGLNATHDVIKMNDRQILISGLTLSGTETGVSSMTFTVNNGGFQSIDEPNSRDVIKTAFAVMSYAQYYPTAIVLNPITVNTIDSEKDTLGRNLDLIETRGGVKYIAGRPIIEYDGIPVGKYLLGDFRPLAAALVDYTNLTLEWAEDVETKLTNQVVLIAQEEIIFPIYNPWAFAYGDLETLKAAITKPTDYAIYVQPTATVGHTSGSDTVELSYQVKPLGTSITWTSSDSTKATVANGVVTGKSAGTAIITASISDGTNTYTDVCVVTVS